jgi:WD40 repeat protein
MLIGTSDGKTAAFAAADNSIVLLNVADGKLLRTLAGHGAVVKGMAFTADGSKLVSGSLDKSIRVWTVADGKLVGQLNTPAPVNDIAASNWPIG